MKDKTYLLNTLLAAILCAVLLAFVLLRTFIPAIILPEMNLPNMALVSLAALLIDHYVSRGAKRCYICIPVFSALSFGILPLAAGLCMPMDALTLGVLGGAMFTLLTWLFTSMQDRIASGPSAKAAPFVSALCLYCAAQCLTAILI